MERGKMGEREKGIEGREGEGEGEGERCGRWEGSIFKRKLLRRNQEIYQTLQVHLRLGTS